MGMDFRLEFEFLGARISQVNFYAVPAPNAPVREDQQCVRFENLHVPGAFAALRTSLIGMA